MRSVPVVFLVVVIPLVSCGAQPEREAAAAVSVEFASNSKPNPARACARLAPASREKLEDSSSKSCTAALPRLGLPTGARVLDAQVFGHSAQVRLTDQTMFLGLFDDGWRVVAAGCNRESDDRAQPYSCVVDGR